MRISFAALAFGLLAAAPAAAQCAAPADRPTLTVRGSARVDRPPDRAELAILVETRGPTLEAATRAHRGRIAQAAAALDRLKRDGVAVDGGTFGLIQERSTGTPGSPPNMETVSYRATTRYDLTVAKLDRLDGLVAEIASTGLFEVGSASFSAAGAADARDAARRAAVADARQRAEVYADAAGLRLDGVDCMAEEARGFDGGEFRLQSGVERAPSVGLAPPKALAFGDEVTVVWRLAPR